MGLFDTVMISSLNKSLDGLWTREKAISDNLANYETPGYRRKSVSFEQELERAMKIPGTQTDVAAQVRAVRPTVEEDQRSIFRADGNGVDVEKESVEMTRTQLQYDYTLRMLNDQFSRLRSAISQGKK